MMRTTMSALAIVALLGGGVASATVSSAVQDGGPPIAVPPIDIIDIPINPAPRTIPPIRIIEVPIKPLPVKTEVPKDVLPDPASSMVGDRLSSVPVQQSSEVSSSPLKIVPPHTRGYGFTSVDKIGTLKVIIDRDSSFLNYGADIQLPGAQVGTYRGFGVHKERTRSIEPGQYVDITHSHTLVHGREYHRSTRNSHSTFTIAEKVGYNHDRMKDVGKPARDRYTVGVGIQWSTETTHRSGRGSGSGQELDGNLCIELTPGKLPRIYVY